MHFPNLFRRRGALAARIGENSYRFTDGKIVAWAEDWRLSHHATNEPVGYSSYLGEIVPVFDLAFLLGQSAGQGSRIVHVRTHCGHLAFVADAVLHKQVDSCEVVELAKLSIFAALAA